jgi:hypothetical protein
MTYTRYCLTDAMLRRLSAIVNGNVPRGVRGGQSAAALERRELVTAKQDGPPWYAATDTGRWALEQARREGW